MEDIIIHLLHTVKKLELKNLYSYSIYNYSVTHNNTTY